MALSCPECDARSIVDARRNCETCALFTAKRLGRMFVTAQQMMRGQGRWLDVLAHRRAGWHQPKMFYVYAAFGDHRLGLLNTPTAGCYPTADEAQREAERACSRHDQVWVVTTLGAWQVSGLRGRADCINYEGSTTSA